MASLGDIVHYAKEGGAIIPMGVGLLLNFLWNKRKHNDIIKRKCAILRNIRFQLAVEILQRVLPPLNPEPPISEQDYREQFQENMKQFLASQDKCLGDFIRCHSRFKTYTSAYVFHRYSWFVFAAMGFGGWLLFSNSSQYLAWTSVAIGIMGIITPWVIMVFQSDRLDDLAGEYEAAE